MFFGCILKALQVKVRGSQDGNRSAKNISITDILIAEELPPHYWFFRGDGDLQLASSVVTFIKDISDVCVSYLKKWIRLIINLWSSRINNLCKLFRSHFHRCGLPWRKLQLPTQFYTWLGWMKNAGGRQNVSTHLAFGYHWLPSAPCILTTQSSYLPRSSWMEIVAE